jgi:hypothetical protein
MYQENESCKTTRYQYLPKKNHIKIYSHVVWFLSTVCIRGPNRATNISRVDNCICFALYVALVHASRGVHPPLPLLAGLSSFCSWVIWNWPLVFFHWNKKEKKKRKYISKDYKQYFLYGYYILKVSEWTTKRQLVASPPGGWVCVPWFWSILSVGPLVLCLDNNQETNLCLQGHITNMVRSHWEAYTTC